jgi:hypothetical protein
MDDITEPVELFDARGLRKILLALAAVYGGVSAACYAGDRVPGFVNLIPGSPAWAWLIGPAGLLLFRDIGLVPYLGASVLLASLVYGTMEAFRRASPWCMFFGAAALLTWMACSFVVLSASI